MTYLGTLARACKVTYINGKSMSTVDALAFNVWVSIEIMVVQGELY